MKTSRVDTRLFGCLPFLRQFFARLGIMFALLVERLQLRPVEDLVANRVGQVLEPAIEIADLEALRSAAAACVTDQPEHDDRDHEQKSEEQQSEHHSLMRRSYA